MRRWCLTSLIGLFLIGTANAGIVDYYPKRLAVNFAPTDAIRLEFDEPLPEDLSESLSSRVRVYGLYQQYRLDYDTPDDSTLILFPAEQGTFRTGDQIDVFLDSTWVSPGSPGYQYRFWVAGNVILDPATYFDTFPRLIHSIPQQNILDLQVADINRDGLVDVIELMEDYFRVYLQQACGLGNFSSIPYTHPLEMLSADTRQMTIRDINYDSLPDVLIHDSSCSLTMNQVKVFLNASSPTQPDFESRGTLTYPDTDVIATLIFDFIRRPWTDNAHQGQDLIMVQRGSGFHLHPFQDSEDFYLQDDYLHYYLTTNSLRFLEPVSLPGMTRPSGLGVLAAGGRWFLHPLPLDDHFDLLDSPDIWQYTDADFLGVCDRFRQYAVNDTTSRFVFWSENARAIPVYMTIVGDIQGQHNVDAYQFLADYLPVNNLQFFPYPFDMQYVFQHNDSLMIQTSRFPHTNDPDLLIHTQAQIKKFRFGALDQDDLADALVLTTDNRLHFYSSLEYIEDPLALAMPDTHRVVQLPFGTESSFQVPLVNVSMDPLTIDSLRISGESGFLHPFENYYEYLLNPGDTLFAEIVLDPFDPGAEYTTWEMCGQSHRVIASWHYSGECVQSDTTQLCLQLGRPAMDPAALPDSLHFGKYCVQAEPGSADCLLDSLVIASVGWGELVISDMVMFSEPPVFFYDGDPVLHVQPDSSAVLKFSFCPDSLQLEYGDHYQALFRYRVNTQAPDSLRRLLLSADYVCDYYPELNLAALQLQEDQDTLVDFTPWMQDVEDTVTALSLEPLQILNADNQPDEDFVSVSAGSHPREWLFQPQENVNRLLQGDHRIILQVSDTYSSAPPETLALQVEPVDDAPLVTDPGSDTLYVTEQDSLSFSLHWSEVDRDQLVSRLTIARDSLNLDPVASSTLMLTSDTLHQAVFPFAIGDVDRYGSNLYLHCTVYDSLTLTGMPTGGDPWQRWLPVKLSYHPVDITWELYSEQGEPVYTNQPIRYLTRVNISGYAYFGAFTVTIRDASNQIVFQTNYTESAYPADYSDISEFYASFAEAGEQCLYGRLTVTNPVDDLTDNEVVYCRQIRRPVITVLPQPFTPNGDGYNDQVVFNFYTLQPEQQYEIDIYDFNGQRAVRLPVSGTQVEWDGTIQGNPAHPGIYLYRITDGKREVKQGKVVLVR